MPKYVKTARFSLWATRFFLLLLLVSLFLMPGFARFYTRIRVLSRLAGTVLLAAYYICAIPSGLALWRIHTLLGNICRGRVFLMENCKILLQVSICCAAVSIVSFAAGVVYPPLLFVAVIMLFLCLLVNVVSSVMKAATALREENDLTI